MIMSSGSPGSGPALTRFQAAGSGVPSRAEEAGLFHREDGPAVEMDDGSKFWFEDGLPHREDGPAVEDAGRRYPRAWFRRGEPCPPEAWRGRVGGLPMRTDGGT